MKKLDIKSLLIGLIIGSLTVGAVSATTLGIKSAQYNETKVIYNGEELQVSQPMITVINEGSQYGSNYMPVRAVLEEMGYEVGWDSKDNAITVKDGDKMTNIEDGKLDTFTQQELDDFVGMFDINSNEEDGWNKVEYIYNGELSKDELCYKLFNTPNLKQITTDVYNSTKNLSTLKTAIQFLYQYDNESIYFLGVIYEKENSLFIDFTNIIPKG